MHEVIRDLFIALDAVAALPQAQAELLRRIQREADQPPDNAGGPTVAAARARLRDLTTPQGEHPYLDEILVTLEAAATVLAALAVPAGSRCFVKA